MLSSTTITAITVPDYLNYWYKKVRKSNCFVAETKQKCISDSITTQPVI